MFHIGQKVIAITEWRVDNKDWVGVPIHKGEIHVIRDIMRNGESLFFEGIPDCYNGFGQLCAYGAECFAPYNPPAQYKEVTFTQIKTPAPCEN